MNIFLTFEYFVTIVTYVIVDLPNMFIMHLRHLTFNFWKQSLPIVCFAANVNYGALNMLKNAIFRTLRHVAMVTIKHSNQFLPDFSLGYQ